MAGYGVQSEEIHFLPEESVHRLFIAAEKLTGTLLSPSDVRLLLETCYDGALRISECLGLCKKDIDQSRKRLILTSTKGGRQKCPKCRGSGLFKEIQCSKCLGNKKIMKNQDAWVSDSIFSALTKRCDQLANPSDRLFPVSRQTAHSYIKRAGEIAGIEAPHIRGASEDQRDNLFPHLLRHSRAVHLLDKGMPLNFVMAKCRHKNIQTTSVYLKVSVRDVIEKEREITEKSKEETIEELERKLAKKKQELK